MSIVDRHRERGLPSPINAATLSRAGISESLIPRTLQALQVLDLIDDAGEPTPTFEAIRLSSQADYPERLAQWLNGAYADVLKFVDPKTASETDIRDAFRTYVPIGQQDRMVSLFMGLCAAAGIGAEKAPRRSRGVIRGVTQPSGGSSAKKTNGAPAVEPKPPIDPPPPYKPAHYGSLKSQLVEKYPPFDPEWGAEIQKAWFAGFEKLLASIEAQEKSGAPS